MPAEVAVRRARRAANFAVVVLLFSAALTSWSLWHARRDTCHARTVQLDVLRDVLVLARKTTDPNRLTPAARHRAELFYRHAFSRIDHARC